MIAASQERLVASLAEFRTGRSGPGVISAVSRSRSSSSLRLSAHPSNTRREPEARPLLERLLAAGRTGVGRLHELDSTLELIDVAGARAESSPPAARRRDGGAAALALGTARQQ